MASWIDDELAGCEFADVRLEKRFKKVVQQLSEGIGETIPMACQDWNTKAAYRFLSNERVNEADILAGHFQSTRDRFRATDGWACCRCHPVGVSRRLSQSSTIHAAFAPC
jgi:hypothetical protein